MQNNKYNDSSLVHWVSSTAAVQDNQTEPHVSTEGRDNTWTGNRYHNIQWTCIHTETDYVCLVHVVSKTLCKSLRVLLYIMNNYYVIADCDCAHVMSHVITSPCMAIIML